MSNISVNRDNKANWPTDISKSVKFFNDWYVDNAPKAFSSQRAISTISVRKHFSNSDNLRKLTPSLLLVHPEMLPFLRMCTCPPIARDRLTGLSSANKTVVDRMDQEGKIPVKITNDQLAIELNKICFLIENMIDTDVFPWINQNREPSKEELDRALIIVSDRLCGAMADPIIRNSQEQRQLLAIESYLIGKGYKKANDKTTYISLKPGEFLFRSSVVVPISLSSKETANIPVDVIIKKKNSLNGDVPFLIEAKSAGDFANVNKRRKEEATKMSQLKMKFGDDVEFVLFLCGYFNEVYLQYESAEGIDWVWEHRIQDLDKFGI